MLLFLSCFFSFFFFNDPATTEIYTLSLHDALPIYFVLMGHLSPLDGIGPEQLGVRDLEAILNEGQDRKSTRLNSSHVEISYAVFCLKKKKKKKTPNTYIKTC